MERKKAIKEFGQMLKDARKRSGISQLSLGVEMGLKSGQFISLIERGKRLLPSQHVNTVSNALGIDQGEIIERLLYIEKIRLCGGVE
jgi:transcriptional regulator with XRE-family HTH domain